MKKIKIKLGFLGLLVIAIVLNLNLHLTQAREKLIALGYNKEQSNELVSYSNMYGIVQSKTNELQSLIYDDVNKAANLGLSDKAINEIEINQTQLYTSHTSLQTLISDRETFLNDELVRLEGIASEHKIKYDYKENDLYQKYLYLDKTVNKKIDGIISDYHDKLIDLGLSEASIKKLEVKDKEESLTKLEDAYQKQLKKLEELDGFQSEALRDQAMRMFNQVNEYRASKGLKPYKYNTDKQACIFAEAKSYANNKNPHNWACQPIANENASLASINSDYVKIAMNFFISDPPHEAVLSGNYTSTAMAFVQRNGMVYMIMGVW